MHIEIQYVSCLARIVLIQLGEQAPDWRLGDIGFLQIGDIVTPDEPTELIRVDLESLSGSYPNVGVQFTTVAPLADATVELATQIQEHAWEVTSGAKLPPCPAHKHPAVAVAVDGVPKWICPQEGVAYFAADILPGFDSAQTVEGYMNGQST